MKKRILSAALAVAMILVCAITVSAANEPEGIEGDLSTPAFFGKTTNTIPLRSGDSYTFQFHNKSNGYTNWENFILGITGAADATGYDQAILILRADSYGWGDGTHFPTTEQVEQGAALPFETDITDWESFMVEARRGFDVAVTLIRDGDTLIYTARMGGHNVRLAATSKEALPETTYVFLTGENCVLTGITTESGVRIRGDLTVTSFFNEKTNMLPLRDGDSYTFKFHNKSNGATNWENFILAVTGADYSFDKAILLLRADSFGWGSGTYFPTIDEVNQGTVLPFETDITDWPAFAAEAQAGFDVTVTLARNGDTLIYTANMGGHNVRLAASARKSLPETAYVFLTGENCSLTGITSENSVGIEGDLTVTTFFGEKTNMLPLRNGDSYTLKFHNKSNGTGSHENFILAVTGADYSFDKAILLLRADSFGWGSGTYFPTVDEVNQGTVLPFETDITDWDAFAAEAQAGFDVTLTLIRDGDTLTYTANLGGHNVRLAVTAKEPLPETACVFLTGENCALTGITAVKNVTDDPTNPPEPTEPTDPTDPAGPTDPTESTEPTEPTAPKNPTDGKSPDKTGLWVALIVVFVLVLAAVSVVIIKKTRGSARKK